MTVEFEAGTIIGGNYGGTIGIGVELRKEGIDG